MKTGTRTIDCAVLTNYDGPFIPRGLAPGEPRTNDLALDFVKASATAARGRLADVAMRRSIEAYYDAL